LKTSLPLTLTSLSGFSKFEWDVKDASDEDLPKLVLVMFTQLGLVEKFSLPHEELCHFVLSVAAGYRENRYHNWRHAFSVARTAFVIAREVQLEKFLTDKELLALFVAALCHDIDHRGRTSGQFCSLL